MESSNTNSTFVSKLIDALLLLRVKLSIRKITSEHIKQSEFEQMLGEVKKSNEDIEVSNAIDKLFEDERSLKESNKSLSLNEMEEINKAPTLILMDKRDGNKAA